MRKHLNTFSAVLFLCSGFMQALMGHVPAAVSAFAAGMLFMGLAISKAGKRRKEEDDDNNKDKK